MCRILEALKQRPILPADSVQIKLKKQELYDDDPQDPGSTLNVCVHNNTIRRSRYRAYEQTAGKKLLLSKRNMKYDFYKVYKPAPEQTTNILQQYIFYYTNKKLDNHATRQWSQTHQQLTSEC